MKSFKGFIQEAIDPTKYVTGSEKSQFGGYRAKLTNAQGKVSYLGSTAYKTPEAAEGEAKAYLDGYSKLNDRTAVRMAKEYASKNKNHLFEMKSNGWIVVNIDTNEPTKNSFTGKVVIYSDEKSANAALYSMPAATRKKYTVEPNFDVWEELQDTNIGESYKLVMTTRDNETLKSKTYSDKKSADSALWDAIQKNKKQPRSRQYKSIEIVSE